MIRKPWDEDKWLLTKQPEHARISGLIAVSWNFSDDKPHSEVKLAIARHDDGWTEAENDPQLNEAGDPMNYLETPPDRAMETARRSIQLLYDEGKYYAARLVAGHFSQLAYQVDLGQVGPRTAQAIGRFIGEQNMLMTRCAKEHANGSAPPVSTSQDDASGTSGDNYTKDLRLLQVCDLLSLLLCGDFSGETVIEDVPYLSDTTALTVSGRGDLNIGLSPMPFKKPLRGLLEAVAVPRRKYENPEDLRNEIAAAKVLSREIHLGTYESAKIPNPGAA
jgi:hypothetical protein